MTWSKDFTVNLWRQSHDCFFIYTCAYNILSVLKGSLCIMIYCWERILWPLYGIGRCPQLGGFLINSPSIGSALSVRYLVVSAIWRCPLFGGVRYMEVFIKGGSTVDGGSFQYFHRHSICKSFIIAMHNDVLLDAPFIGVLHKLVLTEQEDNNKQLNCVL